jgi:protein HIRA/HIR1
LTKYGYGRKHTQLPETPIQLELEEALAAKPPTSNRIAQLMTGNTTIETSSQPINDTTMEEAELIDKPEKDFTSSSSKAAPSVIVEQKVTIAKNGKKRIQPMVISPSSSSIAPSTSRTLTKPIIVGRLMRNAIALYTYMYST